MTYTRERLIYRCNRPRRAVPYGAPCEVFFKTQKEPIHEQTVIINVGGLGVLQVRQSCCREVSLKGKQRSGTKVCGTHEWDHARTTQQGTEECEVR